MTDEFKVTFHLADGTTVPAPEPKTAEQVQALRDMLDLRLHPTPVVVDPDTGEPALPVRTFAVGTPGTADFGCFLNAAQVVRISWRPWTDTTGDRRVRHDNGDGTETVYLCSSCLTPMDEWVETHNGSATVRTCPCGDGQWVRMDGSSLDLGIIRDDQ